MKLDLTVDDARFMKSQLDRRLQELEVELAHTEKRSLQHALAVDVQRMEKLTSQLGHLLEEEVVEEFV